MYVWKKSVETVFFVLHFAEDILAHWKSFSLENFPYPPRLLQAGWFFYEGKEYSWHLDKEAQSTEFCSDTTAESHKVKLFFFSSSWIQTWVNICLRSWRRSLASTYMNEARHKERATKIEIFFQQKYTHNNSRHCFAYAWIILVGSWWNSWITF